MIKDKNRSPKIPAGNMLDQKTNEDFNKKMPDPKDPNEQKDRPETAPPDFQDEEIQPTQADTPNAGGNQQKPPNAGEGSE